MLRKTTLIILILSTFASFKALAFPGETRRYFKDWLVVCKKDPAAGPCRANVGIRNKTIFPYGDGTIFQFTLEREVDFDYHIQFYHTLDDSYPSNVVNFKIDNHPSVTLPVETEGNLAKLTSEQSTPLIPLIKSGRRLSIRYVSQTGKDVDVTLSLRGSSGSMLFIDTFYDLK